MRKISLHVILLLILSSSTSFAFFGWGNFLGWFNRDGQISKAKSMFQEVIEDFDEQQNDVTESIDNGKDSLLTFKEAIRQAKNKDAEFAKVYTKWERVKNDVVDLHKKFEGLVKGADSFYTSLEKRAQTIGDEELKNKSYKQLTESKENYTLRLKSTKAKINELDNLYQKVYDIITALEITYSLDILEEKISKAFNEIDRMVESVIPELNALIKESKALLAQN